MTKEERYESFERYIRGEMNGLEEKELLHLLEQDADLRKEFELHRGLHQAVGDKKMQYFTELVKESEINYFQQKSNKNISFLQKYTRQVAAVTAILAIGLITYFVFPRQADPETLFVNYFELYQSPGTFRTEDMTSLDNDFILALARYDEGAFGEAIGYFNKTIEKYPTKDVAIFLRGVSHLAVDDLDLAEVDFHSVIANSESLFTEKAIWYLGLIYLKQGNIKLTKKTFQLIRKQEKVKKLLLELED